MALLRRAASTPSSPRFLAHLTDNHERVIGYVLEYVPARAAGISDVDLCRAVLQKLHSLGISHGRLSRNDFLLRQDIPVAQMRSFFSAYETTNRDIFDKEMSCLEEVLQQTPPPVPVGYEQLTAFWEPDGWVHPVLFWQMKHDGQITISPEDHRASWPTWRRRTGVVRQRMFKTMWTGRDGMGGNGIDALGIRRFNLFLYCSPSLNYSFAKSMLRSGEYPITSTSLFQECILVALILLVIEASLAYPLGRL